MIERTLTGCTHIEEPDIYQEYVCGYCEFERAQYAFNLAEKLKGIRMIITAHESSDIDEQDAFNAICKLMEQTP